MVSITNTSITGREFNEEGPIDGLICAPSPFTLTEWPDGPAPTYFRNNNFTAADILEVSPTASRWAFYNGTTFASGVLSIESGKIKVAWPSGASTLLRLAVDPRNLTVRIKVTSSINITANINNDGQNYLKPIIANVPTLLDISFLPTTGTVIFDFECSDTGAKTVYLEMAYVGTGTYTSLALDASGNGNNATVYGATPVNTTVGKGFSFDGANDDVSITNFSMPDIFEASMWLNCPQPVISGAFLEQGSIAAGHIFLYRTTGAGLDYLAFTYWNGSARLTVNAIGFFTGLNSVPVLVGFYLNWTTGAYVIKRNGITFQTGTLTTPAKPIISTLHFGTYTLAIVPFLGTIADPRIYNRALSATEVKQLYKLRANN